MPRTTQRAPLNLNDKERKELETLSTSRNAPLREVQRAKILLAYADLDANQGYCRPSLGPTTDSV